MTTPIPTWVSDDSPIPDPLGRGERAIRFFGALQHPLSPYQDSRFGLPKFWERIIRRIYGPRHEDGRRIVRTAFIMLPRGARKTTVVGGGLGLLHAIGPERVPRGQVLLAAGAEDQAEHGLDEAKNIIHATPGLSKAKVRGDYIEHPVAKSAMRLLSSEGDVAHGTTPAAIFLDELHVWKNRKLWRALKTGMVKSPNALLCITTTAGRGQTGLAWEEYLYACKVARGEVDNPSYLPIIFEPPPGADWQDEKIWHLVNPGLAEGFPVLDEMRQAAAEAAEKPGEKDDFKQYNLNFWLDSAVSPFIDMAVYDENAGEVDLDVLRGGQVWISVDLSSTVDLTVILACWGDGEEGYTVVPWFFCPADNLREREDRTGAPYVAWAEKGLITATPGNVVDYRAVETKIRELCEEFDVQEIAFDPHMARQVQPRLTDDGLPCLDMRQIPSIMMDPIQQLERAIVARRFNHGGHPVLRFCFANAEMERNKQGHGFRFCKSKKWLSIDGAVAAAMAVGRASMGEGGSIYDDEEARPDGLIFV